MKDQRTFKDHHGTPIRSIRAFCIQCMGYQRTEVPLCTAPKCPLYPFRMGKRPQGSTYVSSLKELLDITARE